MAKIVLDVVANENPKGNDVIIYNEKNGFWEIVHKEVFLNSIIKELKTNEDRYKFTLKEIKKLQEDLQNLAIILKGEIEK